MDVPSTSRPNQSLQQDAAELYDMGLESLFFFCKGICGMKDLTPGLHGEYADFISNPLITRSVSMIFRAGLKTSVGTIGKNLQIATQFLEGKHRLSGQVFELPLLLCMSTATNVKKISRMFGELYDNSPVYRWLYPDIVKGAEWSKDVKQLVKVDRVTGKVLAQVTLDFKGVESKMSSNHYRGITFDDIHAAEEAMESPPSVEMVVGRYEHSDSLLIEPDKDFIHLIGSCSSLHPPDVFMVVKERESDRFKWFVRPCYDKDSGKPVWPERFPRSVLEAIRRKEGDVKFSYQYLLDPIDELVAEFRMSDFPNFSIFNDGSGPSYVSEDMRKYRLVHLNTFSIVDPAGWRGDGDENAILTGGTAPDGRHLLLEEFEERCDPDTVLKQLVDHHKRYSTSVIGVEEVAYQETLSFYLEKLIQKEQLPIRVVPCKTRSKNKDTRIRGVQPLSKQRQILLHDGLVKTRSELSHFPKGKKHLLDCLAYLSYVTSVPVTERLEELEDIHRQAYLRALGESEYEEANA